MQAARLDGIYTPSKDIVAREIEGEMIIVPLVDGIGNADDDLFSLNDTGQAIWKRLDGRVSLRQLAISVAEEYDAPLHEIEQDVLGLAAELVRRRLIIEEGGERE